MYLSVGAKKDLLILQFAYALLKISNETIDDANIIHRADNKIYKVNKKIDKAVNKLITNLQMTIEIMYQDNPLELQSWVKAKMLKRVGVALSNIQDEVINLEYLALLILYVNFCEHDKKLREEYLWLEDAEQYFVVMEMLNQTKAGIVEADAQNLAYDLVEFIKR